VLEVVAKYKTIGLKPQRTSYVFNENKDKEWYYVELSGDVWNSFLRKETNWLEFFARDELDAYVRATRYINKNTGESDE
jgi:hypothetical protein